MPEDTFVRDLRFKNIFVNLAGVQVAKDSNQQQFQFFNLAFLLHDVSCQIDVIFFFMSILKAFLRLSWLLAPGVASPRGAIVSHDQSLTMGYLRRSLARSNRDGTMQSITGYYGVGVVNGTRVPFEDKDFVYSPDIPTNGTIISAANANEVVIIPDPPSPVIPARSNCPHEDSSLLDWHSPSTWDGSLPRSGNDIVLPENARVVIRRSVRPVLGLVTIPASSSLVFGENSTGITFDAHGIDVKGNLTMGSETCRIETPITLTLHGDRPVDAVTNPPAFTYKGIVVTGRISLHGKRFYRTWTRLARTVEPGESVVLLQHAVNWDPDTEIVLVTTAMKDSREWHRNEISVVKQVVTDPLPGVGSAVFLQNPVTYQHLAIKEYQGEVGLLTRSIKIQGNEASEPTDPDPLNCKTNKPVFGNRDVPCAYSELTGYGGHIVVHDGGKGYVEGVELYRLGQTNVLARYPMHFHILEDTCRDCYFRDSSVHRSFFRCISIHGTNYVQVSENVAYDITGFCYYLEDGVEHHNRIEFNLGAHIHTIGPEPPRGAGQRLSVQKQNSNLTLPADISASAFYITNVQNYLIGNAASGGWAGFAFPNLDSPLGPHRDVKLRPSSVTGLTIDGNTAHSSTWWWYHAAAFYFGGSIYYNDEGLLMYNPGRDQERQRSTCLVNKCSSGLDRCGDYCGPQQQAWLRITNTKVFLAAGVGLGSWSNRLEVLGFECHDCGLTMEAISSDGFWASNMLSVCRSYSPIVLPDGSRANSIPGNGFNWYDTGQSHIVTNTTFRNCGIRSNEYSQYDQNPDRGCGNEADIGCNSESSVWGFITHSDSKVPEVMQATRNITFENCGRRFRFRDFRKNRPSSVSGREQNWYDADGTITGLGERSVAASGLADAGMWWKVDDEGKFSLGSHFLTFRLPHATY
jgi:hypothetical protein